MVRNQDDESFLSWTATLHPESATGTIGSNHYNETASSPWVTVYNEACAETFPIATEVVIFDEEEQQHQQELESLSNNPSSSSFHPNQSRRPPHPRHTQNNDNNYYNPNNNHSNTLEDQQETMTTTNHHHQQQQQRPQPWKHSNLIDLILGISFTLVAVIWTFKLELVAFMIYIFAVSCHYVIEKILTSSIYILVKAILLLLASIFLFVDSILLTVSVLVTEIVGAVALFLCTMFGGIRSGSEWHQFIRRLCHLTRWAFRSCHRGWKPERAFPISLLTENDDDDDDAEVSRTMSQSQPFTRSSSHDGVPTPQDDDEDTSFHNTPYTDDATLTTYQDDGLPTFMEVPPEAVSVSIPSNGVGAAAATTTTTTTTPRYHLDHPTAVATTTPAGVIAVAPENVSLVHDNDEGNEDHGDNRFFIKNTQRVDIL